MTDSIIINYDNVDVCDNASTIFPDYKNDETFGGVKKYIKLLHAEGDDRLFICYLNPSYSFDDDDDLILYHEMNYNVIDKLSYFYNTLIKNRTILIDTIYDMYDSTFIDMINNTKFMITIEYYDEFIANNRIHCTIDTMDKQQVLIEKMRRLFYCSMMINDYYCTLEIDDEDKDEDNDDDYLSIDVGVYNYNIIEVYRIHSKYYDLKTLQKYVPYIYVIRKHKKC
jgi:hypothetical protein